MKDQRIKISTGVEATLVQSESSKIKLIRLKQGDTIYADTLSRLGLTWEYQDTETLKFERITQSVVGRTLVSSYAHERGEILGFSATSYSIHLSLADRTVSIYPGESIVLTSWVPGSAFG